MVGKPWRIGNSSIELFYFTKCKTAKCQIICVILCLQRLGVQCHIISETPIIYIILLLELVYMETFLPSAIREWNELSHEIRTSDSLNFLKSKINQTKPVPNRLYFHGNRKIHVLHTRIRNNCSALNNHLFLKNIVTSPLCDCGHIESSQQYFLECVLYQQIRHRLVNRIIRLTRTVTLAVLLYGDNNLTLQNNISIFDKVHTFMRDSKRF